MPLAPTAAPVALHTLLGPALAAAAEHADAVDRDGRFPAESIGALKSAGALGCYVPVEYGGLGASFEDLADATFELSRRCAASGMVFAMHQIQVATIVHHMDGSAWFANYLRRLASEQRLISSATSEVGVGGDLRSSIAAVETVPGSDGLTVRFEKKASTISYGAHSEDVLTSLRRSPEADKGDQVMILTHVSEMEMEPMGVWDTLGMRGTCSPGFTIRAQCSAEQVLPLAFSTMCPETVVPFSHLLWAQVWLGTAAAAFDRAQSFVRSQARQSPGTMPPTAHRLAELSARMAEFRGLVKSATTEYVEAIATDRERLMTMGYAVRINNVKLAASEAVVEVCNAALRICGFLGYKNGTPYSIGRQLRDGHSAALMIANDRILATNASLLLVHREGK
jgi:acyl-CoA dehydrogenase